MTKNTSDRIFPSSPVGFSIRQHTIPQSILLHLLPGALITAFFFLAAPVLIESGFPPILSLYLAILLVLIPFELGFLFYQGKKLDGRYSLNGIVLFRERIPIGKMILMIISLFAWSGLVFTLLPKLDALISETLFAWFPGWSSPNNLLGNVSQYSKTALKITIVAGFLLNGIAGPIVEELYFRSYLLPRIPASRWWAPLINITLFSLYHFFTPWQNISRILAFLPLSYAVAWKRNIYLSMWAHCLLNTAGMIISFML
ncbi:MAG: CPBP family intramembrane metalloprotease [Anaerolineaceae bacterium]|nr:CPBP family intramembrane metalloprotease [Anaerolineaceae bacterium]